MDVYRNLVCRGTMKHLVTEYHALNINALARGAWLLPFSTYEWVWRTSNGALPASVRITALPDALRLVYALGAERILQHVQLVHSIGPRGGQRPWFACLQCQQRVGVLYHADKPPFLCRLCSDLVYPSQYSRRPRNYGRQHQILRYQDRISFGASCGERP